MYQRPRHIANRQNRRYKGRATGNSYQQRVRELVAPPRPVVHGPAWRGGDRLGARRAGAQGARPSAVDTCDMPSSDAEKSPRIPCVYTICHAPRFRHARTPVCVWELRICQLGRSAQRPAASPHKPHKRANEARRAKEAGGRGTRKRTKSNLLELGL